MNAELHQIEEKRTRGSAEERVSTEMFLRRGVLAQESKCDGNHRGGFRHRRRERGGGSTGSNHLGQATVRSSRGAEGGRCHIKNKSDPVHFDCRGTGRGLCNGRDLGLKSGAKRGSPEGVRAFALGSRMRGIRQLV